MAEREQSVIVKLAYACRDQVAPFKPGSKKREEAVLAFWAGAMRGLHAVDHEHAAWVSRVAFLLIATRGYSEVERIISDFENAAPQD